MCLHSIKKNKKKKTSPTPNTASYVDYTMRKSTDDLYQPAKGKNVPLILEKK